MSQKPTKKLLQPQTQSNGQQVWRTQTVLAQALTSDRFLLHYVTRDELGVLAQGGDGLPGIKQAFAAYTEQSPLYGFICHHEKTALLRYVPSSTTRLLQGT